MKAMELTSKNNFRLTEIPKPSLSKDKGSQEVLVKVRFTAFDTVLHYFLPKHNVGAAYVHDVKTKPLILGYHYVGTVVDMSKSVPSDVNIGDVVYGHLDYKPDQKQGALSEYIIVNYDEFALAPKGFDEASAAASTTESLTALQALRDRGQLQPGNRVLILGAGGGVGSAAVSIAKQLGAKDIVAVCSTKDVEKVRQLGANSVIDRRKSKGWESDPHLQGSFDIVLDASSRYSFVKVGRIWLKSGGTFVNLYPLIVEQMMFGWLWKIIFPKKKMTMTEVKARRSDLILLRDWLATGKVTAQVDSVYDISNISEAVQQHEAKKSGSHVVIKVENGW